MLFRKRKARSERHVRMAAPRSAPAATFPVSDHCDGRRFRNTNGHQSGHRVLAFLRWTATRHLQLRKGPGARPSEQASRAGLPVREAAMSVTWVGHSTLLLKMDGLNLLTDPIWSARCSPLAFAGPRRRQPPGMAFEELPKIDLVLISHNHYDHLDGPTVKRLAATHDPLFIVPLGVAAWFKRHRMHRVVELDWWQSLEHGPLRVHATPAQHFSGRTPWDANKTLWCSFVVEGPAGRFFFAGDTGHGPHFSEIGRRFAPFRLAAIPIGAYEPRWFMGPVHIDPDQAVQAHQELGSLQSVSIHFGTFKLTDEPMDEPPILLRQSLVSRGIDPELFWVLAHGETRSVPERQVEPAAVEALQAAEQ